MKTNAPIMRCHALYKSYHDGHRDIEVLKGVDFVVQPGESVAIVGRSGSGKTTLVNLLGGLELPSAGQVFCDEQDFKALSDHKRGYLRNRILGLIFQFHHLLPEFNALENVAMPLLIRGVSAKHATAAATQALEKVGLAARTLHRPAMLSGGERQRVAIARAFVTEPKCILADEPTGNLDEENAAQIYELMRELTATVGTSFVVVTHDMGLANKMDRVVKLVQGKLVTLS